MKANAVSLDITPRRPLPLGSPTVRGDIGKKVAEKLEANIVLLDDEEGCQLVVVSLDLLYVGEPLVQEVRSRVGSIPADRIVLAASHTHRAPMTDATKPGLGRTDIDYVQWLATLISEAIEELCSSVRDKAWLKVWSGKASHSINRRGRTRLPLSAIGSFRGVTLTPNPRGPVDETVTTVVVSGPDGAPVSVLWNYACHPVAYPRSSVYAAHFPGVVRQAMRDRYGMPGLPVVYLQGFSGNTRPHASARARQPKRWLKRVLGGPVFDDMSPRVYDSWTKDLSRVVVDGAHAAELCEVPGFTVRRHEVVASDFASGAPGTVSFLGARIGSKLCMLGVSAEIVSEYALALRTANPGTELMLVGCLDNPFGYVPTAQMLEEGGYEAGAYVHDFGLDRLSATIENDTLAGMSVVAAGLATIPASATVRR